MKDIFLFRKKILYLILFSICAFVILTQSASAQSTIYVPDDYSKIQWAINNASAGDIIIVRDGIYSENLIINKNDLMIVSENGNSVIQASNPSSAAVIIGSKNVTISGFIIRGGSYGIQVSYYAADLTKIYNNTIEDFSQTGIFLGTDGNRVENNSISQDGTGMLITHSNDNIVSNNTLGNLRIRESENNTLKFNEFSEGVFIEGYSQSHYTHEIEGNRINGRPLLYLQGESLRTLNEEYGEIIVVSSENIRILDQNFSGYVGVEIAFSNNISVENSTFTSYYGIYGYDVEDLSASSNIFESNSYGIWMEQCDYGSFTANEIYRSGTGIHLENSENNTFRNNTIYDSQTGIFIQSSDNNSIYLNNFIFNDEDIYVETAEGVLNQTNFFNSTEQINYEFGGEFHNNFIGNYWSGYSGSDENGDGIGEMPYLIYSEVVIGPAEEEYRINHTDYHPLMQRWEKYFGVPIDSQIIINLNTSEEFLTIQAAIDDEDSQNGHILVVYPGVYCENVEIDKSVTLRSFSDNPEDTVIRAKNRSLSVLQVEAENVTIRGFTIEDASSTSGLPSGAHPPAGIKVVSSNLTVSNCIFKRDHYGVYLLGDGNRITDCKFENILSWPIYAYQSSYNMIENSSFTEGGIQLYYYSESNVIKNNTIRFSPTGIYVHHFSHHNRIEGNTIYNSSDEGINLYLSDFNEIRNNTITLCEYGVEMYGADSNIIAGNTIRNNYVGVHLFSECEENLIYNNFFENNINAHGTGAEWNITKKAGRNIVGGPYLGGNYWSDYVGEDLDGDGIGDTNLPHTCGNRIEGDWLPLVYHLPVHNLNTSEDFSTIQAAIDDEDTQDGHVILIDPGRYEENVNVTKELTITSYGGAEIVAESADHVFRISANNVTISNLTISGAVGWSGIFCKAGIYASHVSNLKVLNNSINNNSCGVYLYYSNGSTVKKNEISENDYGIYLHDFAQENEIEENLIANNQHGIHFEFNANNNTVFSNILNRNDVGIHSYNSDNNTIYNNYFNNTINANEVQSNNSWNVTAHVRYDTTTTPWKMIPNVIGGPSFGGNYWSDYSGRDEDEDGLGDTLLPYNCSGRISGDWHPLTRNIHLIESSTGSGQVEFTTSDGEIEELEALDVSSLPDDAIENMPSGLSLPHGLFSFRITGLTPGGEITLTIVFPSEVPVGFEWWKVNLTEGNNTWYSIPVGDDDGDNVITVTLRDGGEGDHDGEENGVIVDPSGLGSLPRIYHISPDGDDSNDGSELHPWKSLSKINELNPGDIVILHGEFNEAVDLEVSGSEGAPIRIIGDNAIINGSGISRDGFVIRPNASYLTIENLRITNFSSHWGLALYGNNSHIMIRNVEVENCDTGIHLTAGYSGQEPMYGAVDNVTVEGVRVHDNSVGGLDCTPGPCYNLTILNSSFYNNGIQAGFGADGIAVEVGDDILIRNVTAMNNGGDGIDIGSRNPLFISESANVTVRESIIANNGMQGLKLWAGGRAVNCLIHSNGLEGLVLVYNGDYLIQHCDIVKNALEGGYAFTAGYPESEPLGEQSTLNITIQNSIFAFNGNLSEAPTGIWIGDSMNFSSQNSIYFSRDFEEIYFNDTGEPITREQINMGRLGVNFGLDPKFVNFEDDNFHLSSLSPAIDNGTDSGVNVDLEYNPRPVGSDYDIGCYEFVPVKGDFNGNEEVDIGDVTYVAHMVVGKIPQDLRADFNGNNRVDIGDLAKIAYYLLGKIGEI